MSSAACNSYQLGEQTSRCRTKAANVPLHADSARELSVLDALEPHRRASPRAKLYIPESLRENCVFNKFACLTPNQNFSVTLDDLYRTADQYLQDLATRSGGELHHKNEPDDGAE